MLPVGHRAIPLSGRLQLPASQPAPSFPTAPGGETSPQGVPPSPGDMTLGELCPGAQPALYSLFLCLQDGDFPCGGRGGPEGVPGPAAAQPPSHRKHPHAPACGHQHVCGVQLPAQRYQRAALGELRWGSVRSLYSRGGHGEGWGTHQLEMDGKAEQWLDAWGCRCVYGQQRNLGWASMELTEVSAE